MPPEELRRGPPRRFPWAGNSEEKEAPLGARCLPGVLDGTVLPPFSLLFFPLLSHTVFHRRFLSLFPLRPSCSCLLLLLPPSILFSLQRFSISFRYSNEKPNCALGSFVSLSLLLRGYLSFSYSGSPSFLPPGRTAAGSAKRSLDGDKGPSYRS